MIKGLPLAYNKDFQEDKEALFDAFRTTRDCVEAMAILFEEGLDFRVERLNEAVEQDFSNATDVADYLVYSVLFHFARLINWSVLSSGAV